MNRNSQRIHLRAIFLLALGWGLITPTAAANSKRGVWGSKKHLRETPTAEANTVSPNFDEYLKDWTHALTTNDPIAYLRTKYSLPELYEQAKELYRHPKFEKSFREHPETILRLLPLKNLAEFTDHVLKNQEFRKKFGRQIVTEILYRIAQSMRLDFPKRLHEDIKPPADGAKKFILPTTMMRTFFPYPSIFSFSSMLALAFLPDNQLTQFLLEMKPLMIPAFVGIYGASFMLLANQVSLNELGIGWESHALNTARKLAQRIDGYQLPEGVTWKGMQNRVNPSLCKSVFSAALPRTLKGHLTLQASVAVSAALLHHSLRNSAPEVLDTPYFSNQWEKAGLLIEPLKDPEHKKRVATQLVKFHLQKVKARAHRNRYTVFPSYLQNDLAFFLYYRKIPVPERYQFSNGEQREPFRPFMEELLADPNSETAKNAWLLLEQLIIEGITEKSPTIPFRGHDLNNQIPGHWW